MSLTTTPDLTAVYTKLRALVLAVVESGVEVIQGLGNREPWPPASPGFVVMTAIAQVRLRTNVDTYDDPTQPPGPPFTVGTRSMEQGTQLTVQLDCYGVNSGVWAAQLSTVLRDPYGVDALAPDCAPLYAEDPRMAPLVDDEKQYAQRWIVGAVLQWNPATVTPQEFADTLDVTLVEIDERYPP